MYTEIWWCFAREHRLQGNKVVESTMSAKGYSKIYSQWEGESNLFKLSTLQTLNKLETPTP